MARARQRFGHRIIQLLYGWTAAADNSLRGHAGYRHVIGVKVPAIWREREHN